MPDPKALNKNDAAAYLGVSLTKFKALEAEGLITRCEGTGSWYSVEALDEWVNGGSNDTSN